MRALFLAAAGAALCACDRGERAARPQGRAPDSKSRPEVSGSSGGTVGLRGDAALYYLYRHHLTNDGMGPQGRYYLSKEGRVFYKDAQDREHTVRAPSEGMRVSRSEAEPYKDIRGYQGQQNGRDLSGLAADDEKK